MNKLALTLALPAALGLAACGEELDGGDLDGGAEMEAGDPTVAGEAGMSADGENPAEDGMLQTDIEPTADDMAGSAPEDAETTDPAM